MQVLESNTGNKIKISKIKIGLRFRHDLGDVNALVQSIKEIGLLHPVVLNQNNQLIAGQRRLEACKLLGLKEIPATIINLDNIVTGEFHENVIRKGFTSREKIAIKKAIEPIEKMKALERKQLGRPSEESTHGRTRDKIANYLELSFDTLNKLELIVEASDNNTKFKELPEQIDSKKLSVNQAYRMIEKEKLISELMNTKSVKLSDSVKLIHGDFRIKSKTIPDESVSLVFVDPLYDKHSISLYGDIARVAGRVLKAGGSCVLYCSNYFLPSVIESLNNVKNLKYWWLFCEYPYRNLVHRRHVYNYFRILLWYVKGNKQRYSSDSLADFIEVKSPNRDKLYRYQQSIETASYIIKNLTVENDLVFDPCMGSASSGVAALGLNRKYIGIEKDKSVFAVAKGRLSIKA